MYDTIKPIAYGGRPGRGDTHLQRVPNSQNIVCQKTGRQWVGKVGRLKLFSNYFYSKTTKPTKDPQIKVIISTITQNVRITKLSTKASTVSVTPVSVLHKQTNAARPLPVLGLMLEYAC